MTMEPPRTTFSSTLGAVMATAGVAIGLGNIWRFPYMMGKYGGSSFLMVYLLIVIVFGVPGLMVEWSLGRRTRQGPFGAFTHVGMPGGRTCSALLLTTVVMAASYYGVVVAWVLQEGVAIAVAGAQGRSAASFTELTKTLGPQYVYLALTVSLGCLALWFGVRRGIERASKAALPLFFAIFIVLVIRSLTLPGAAVGLRRFLAPDWSSFTGSTALAALGQAIFSLGLGGMFMLQYGSYMRNTDDIPKQAALTAAADVGAAVLAGLIIVPAVFALGVDLTSGPSLLFEVMPGVFERMPAGWIFGALFFFSIFAVAALSLIAAFEVMADALGRGLGWSRRRSAVVVGVVEITLAAPAYLIDRYVELSDLIWGSTMQPVGAALAVIALMWCVGRAGALEEIRRNSSLPVPQWLYYWVKYAMPLAIVVILVGGWIDWLGGA